MTRGGSLPDTFRRGVRVAPRPAPTSPPASRGARSPKRGGGKPPPAASPAWWGRRAGCFPKKGSGREAHGGPAADDRFFFSSDPRPTPVSPFPLGTSAASGGRGVRFAPRASGRMKKETIISCAWGPTAAKPAGTHYRTNKRTAAFPAEVAEGRRGGFSGLPLRGLIAPAGDLGGKKSSAKAHPGRI
jgi:hypothetical protein